MERKSLKLSTKEWQRLEYLANKLDTCAAAGIRFGKPSWRSLIKAIANGDIKLEKIR